MPVCRAASHLIVLPPCSLEINQRRLYPANNALNTVFINKALWLLTRLTHLAGEKLGGIFSWRSEGDGR